MLFLLSFLVIFFKFNSFGPNKLTLKKQKNAAKIFSVLYGRMKMKQVWNNITE